MEIFLYHYYEATTGPFKNLSKLSITAVQQVMEQLKTKSNVFASKRSDDYLEIRRELEGRARDLFILKGGEPVSSYPHYMTLGECVWIKDWYQNGRELRLRLDEFDESAVSFTYGDLFPTMRYKDGKPYRETVYTKREILELAESIGLPQDWNHDGSKGPERYIEAQVWDDKVIGKYLRRGLE
jgi:hypothetical protein